MIVEELIEEGKPIPDPQTRNVPVCIHRAKGNGNSLMPIDYILFRQKH